MANDKNCPISATGGKIKLCGTAAIGTKGQIVIPKDVRDLLGLQPGTGVTILVKDDKFVGLIRNDNLLNLIEYARAEGVDLE